MKILKVKPGFKLLLISGSLTFVTFAGWLIFAFLIQIQIETTPVETVKVTKDKVENKITGESGILKLGNQREIKSPVTGTVEQILVKVGDNVRKGQTLIRLRDAESQIKLQEFAADLKDKQFQLENKQSSLQIANQNLLDVKKEYEQLGETYKSDIEKLKQEKLWEIEKMELQVNQKQTSLQVKEDGLKEAKVKLSEDKQLFERGFISETELKQQEKQVVQSETGLKNAQNDVYISNLDLERKLLDLKRFIQNVRNNNSEPQKKLKQARSKVKQAEEKVEQARLNVNQVVREIDKLKLQRQKIIEELRKTVITSPMNGRILNVQAQLGDVVEPKANILVMGDPSQQIVELKLSPFDATRVQLQQKAEISIVGFQDQKFSGEVKEISLLAGDGENNSRGGNNVKISAVVGLDEVKKNIVPGTPVTVTLIISQRENVMVIPSEAIQQQDGKDGKSESFVWMRDEQGKARKQVIETGVQGLDKIEVKSGLKAGDEVLIPLFKNPINEGDMVVVE